MRTIEFNLKRLDKFERAVAKINSRALQIAMRAGANNSAFHARREAVAIIRGNMILRSRWTETSIRVEKARSSRDPFAIMGSTAPYMVTQEFGGIKPTKGKEGVLIPTPAASGESGLPRRRLPASRFAMKRISLSKGGTRKAKNAAQELVFRVQDAVKNNQRFTYLDFGPGRPKGIYRIVKGARNFKRGWPRGAKAQKLYDMSRQSVVIPPNPWLRPAVDRTLRVAPRLYMQALIYQLRRAGL